LRWALFALAACSSNDGGGASIDAASDTGATVDAPPASLLGEVTAAADIACPQGAPPTAACKRVTVANCPTIEGEAIEAVVAIAPPAATSTLKGLIVHFSGGGGTSFQLGGAQMYGAAGFRQAFVAWASDWEQTQSAGIRAAGCRPATLLRWIFDEVHGASRTLAFCGEGFSGGSGQLGYALAHYGLGDYLDYVNELSGPPFARIDLGCDGDAPATAMVCGAAVTMQLPGLRLDAWENIAAPNMCGMTNVPPAELERWKSDSIAVGALAYPKTRIEFFVCTNQATAVTGMGQLYHDAITSDKAFHCYSQAENCQGEGLGDGNAEAVQAMIAGCTPRH
jgi:hypothetical protein